MRKRQENLYYPPPKQFSTVGLWVVDAFTGLFLVAGLVGLSFLLWVTAISQQGTSP